MDENPAAETAAPDPPRIRLLALGAAVAVGFAGLWVALTAATGATYHWRR